MTDLSTTYLGLALKNPIVASASPLSKKVEKARQLEEAGAAAIVMYSLFEEQIIHESLELDHFLTRGTDTYPEALTYLPDTGTYSMGPDKYLSHVTALKKAVNIPDAETYKLVPDKYLAQVTALKKALSIPVIGSLNGVSRGGWTRYARLIQDAGADALELNLYYLATDPDLQAADLEAAQADLVAEVRAATTIPLAVKLSPFVTSLPNFARRIVAAGADGLVLFNRFYQPDFDLDELEIVHSLDLSTPAELRLPLRWISILYGKLDVDFALTSGVHSCTEVLKGMMAGARVTMMASGLLHQGPGLITAILSDLQAWMQEHEYESIRQMQGSMSQQSVAEPAAFERANYMRVLSSFRDLP